MALTAPFLGAYADESGPRKPWVIGFSLLCIFSCFGLWFAEPNASDVAIYLVIACFIMGLIGVEYAVVFNNAMLPDLASPGKLGKLSGYGWAMGYVGALLALPIMLWLTGQLPGVTGPTRPYPSRGSFAGPFLRSG